MPLKKSMFNSKYFSYTFKKILPYIILMGLIIFTINVVVYSFGGIPDSQTVNLLDISYPNIFFLYTYPVLLAVGLFKFLFSKKTSDFFGSTPLTRTEMYVTNMAVGIVSIFLTTLVNTLFMAFVFPSFLSVTSVIQPVVIVNYFFFWFAAFLTMFSMAALAASISGTIVGHILLTGLFAFLPGILLMILQIPAMSVHVLTSVQYFNNEIMFSSIDNIMYMISAPFYFVNQIYFAATPHLGDFYGILGDMSGVVIVAYNLFLSLVLLVLGSLFLKKRRFETAEKSYANNTVLNLVKAGFIFPILFLFFRYIKDLMDITQISLFAVLITVLYIIVDLLLQKGFRQFGRSMLLYLGCALFSLVFSFGIAYVEDVTYENSKINISDVNVSEIEIYMDPVGVYTDNRLSVPEKSIKLSFTDEKLLDLFIEGLIKDTSYNPNLSYNDTVTDKEYAEKYGITQEEVERYTSYFMTITVNNKKYTNSYSMPERFNTRLYELIENNEDYKSKLEYYNITEKATILSASYIESINNDYQYYYNDRNENLWAELSDKTFVKELIKKINAEHKNLDISQKYSLLKDYTASEVYYRQYSSSFNGKSVYSYPEYYNYENYNILPFSSEYNNKSYIKVLLSYESKYYIFVSALPDSVNKEDFYNDINMKNKNTLSDFNDFYSRSYYFPSKNDSVPLLAQKYLQKLTMKPLDLKEVALKAKPIENNGYGRVGINFISNNNQNETALIFLDWERDILPLIKNENAGRKKFEDYNLDDISWVNSLSFVDASMVVKQASINKRGNISNFRSFFELLKQKENLEYYSYNLEIDDFKGKEVIMLDVYFNDNSNHIFYFDVDKEFDAAYFELFGSEIINSNTIEKLTINGIEIMNAEDIDYFSKAITSYRNGFYYYSAKEDMMQYNVLYSLKGFQYIDNIMLGLTEGMVERYNEIIESGEGLR